jgi:ATP-dependent Clp protease adaptor protein ClpS
VLVDAAVGSLRWEAEVEGATVEPVLAGVLAGGGSPAAPVRERAPETRERTVTDRPWDVIVWDDPVNLMSYVVFVFRRVFGYPEPVARQLMLEVHRKGKALVATEPREQAELYVQQLHGYGLHATMQRAS